MKCRHYLDELEGIDVRGADLILGFVAHKVLSSPLVRLAYQELKSPLKFCKEKALDLSQTLDDLIKQQEKINKVFKNSFLFIPVASRKLSAQYAQFQQKTKSKGKNKIENIVQNIQKWQAILNQGKETILRADVEAIVPFLKSLGVKCDEIGKNLDDNPHLISAFSGRVLQDLKDKCLKNRLYSFEHDTSMVEKKQHYLNKGDSSKLQVAAALDLATQNYLKYKNEINEILYQVETYHNHPVYKKAVQGTDFLPQVLWYARAVKNLNKDVMLSQSVAKFTDRNLPHVIKEAPTMVTIYNTHSVNLFVHNIGSYAAIAKKEMFESFMAYFLDPTPANVLDKEDALYVLMQIEVIRNPSSLLTNVMFLLLTQEKSESLRHTEDIRYTWSNIEQLLPMAMKNAVKQSISIEYQLFLHKIISGKRFFDYRQVVTNSNNDDGEKLSDRNSDILFDWICYKSNAKELLDQLNKDKVPESYKLETPSSNIVYLTSPEYCFEIHNYQALSNKNPPRACKPIRLDNNPSDGTAYLHAIRKFPLTVFTDVLSKYKVGGCVVSLDKLKGSIECTIKVRDVQDCLTPQTSAEGYSTQHTTSGDFVVSLLGNNIDDTEEMDH